MRVGPPSQTVQVQTDKATDYIRAIREVMQAGTPGQDNPPDIIVTIVPSKREDRYKAIKNECYSKLGVNNQIVLSKTLRRNGLEPILQNIAVQMNAKLGGKAWGVKAGFKNCMLVGIDASHDPQLRAKSSVVLVATTDKEMARYVSFCERQTVHTELFDGLQICMLKALQRYKQENGAGPDRIVVFRDGVGDGRLQFTRDYEVPQLLEAFKKFQPNYEPKLSFVVVSKRILAKFTVQNDRGQMDNPPRGTVVDHTVTRAYREGWPNFYLVSQAATRGTVSPTHYILIYDNSKLEPDHLQKLTYKLTFMYTPNPGSVRVPAPCLYADKLAGMVANLNKAPHPKMEDYQYYI